MALQAKILGITTLTTTLTPIYTVPAGTTTRITKINIAMGATQNAVTIQLHDASRNITKNIWNAVVRTANTAISDFDTLGLEAGDQIIMRSASATDIDVILLGIEDVPN